MTNQMKLEFLSLPENEAFARSVVSAFALPLNPTLSELSDIKTAISEAVTNCIVHAYDQVGTIELSGRIEGDTIFLTVADKGKGIKNVQQALQPFFTTLENEEHSGMGFTIMQTFMTEFYVDSTPDKGTKVYLSKKIGDAE